MQTRPCFGCTEAYTGEHAVSECVVVSLCRARDKSSAVLHRADVARECVLRRNIATVSLPKTTVMLLHLATVGNAQLT
jgi:hypothetical protein